MKCVSIVFLIFVASQVNADLDWGQLLALGAQVAQTVLLDQSFKPYLDNLRPILKTGNDSMNIPMVDPYEQDYQKINISNEILVADGNLTNVVVHGLSEYNVNSATFNVAQMKVKSNVTWPSVVMNSTYNLDAEFKHIMNLSVYGEGAMTWELYNLTLDITTFLELRDGKVFAKSMATNMTIDSNWFYASGIYGGDFYSVIISDVITTWLPAVVENYPWVIIDPFNEKCLEVINKRYQNATLEDLKNAIGVANTK